MVDMHSNSYYSIYHMADMSDYSIYLSDLAANPPTDITLAAARSFAREYRWVEVKHNSCSGFVAFQQKSYLDDIRLVVFYKTGTVLSEMDHPDKGPTKLFRMHVDSKLMGQLFENPRKHSNLGYYSPGGKRRRLEEQSWNYPSESLTLDYFIKNINEEILKLSKLKSDLIAKTVAGKKSKKQAQDEKDPVDEIEPIGTYITKRSTEVAKKGCEATFKQVEGTCGDNRLILEISCEDGESGKRGRICMEDIDIEARSENSSSEEDEDVDDENMATKNGDTLGYCVSKDLHKFLDNINLRQATCLLALPCGGILYNKGEKTYWTRGVFNPDIYTLLKNNNNNTNNNNNSESQCTAISGPLRTCAIGSMYRYYISTAGGVSYWYGPKSMETTILSYAKNGVVDCVAFGCDFNSYVIMYRNGRIVYSNIPKKLEGYILKYTKSKQRWPNFIAMGPSRRNGGQFFIRFTDHTWKCGGMDEKDETYLYGIQGEVREVSFAEKGIVVRYNEASAS